MPSNLFQLEEIAVLLLLTATLVGIAARRLRVPYTVGLVLVGAALTFFSQLEIAVQPELILGILVPPLVFEAAFHLPLQDLRQDLRPILILATLGVLLTTFIVGAVVFFGAGLAWPYAVVFGAIIAATDPVAVIALFRAVGVPRRLQVLLEGESLLNDGTAIVVYKLAVGAAVAGSFSLAQGLADFFVTAGLGLLVGLTLGWLASLLIARIDDYLIETSLTFVLAYGAYISAEYLHASGVLAVVAAGLVCGNVGPRGMSATTRIVVFNFWEFISFLANSFVFLLIGLVIDLPVLLANWPAILWGILAALFSRAIVVYGLLARSRSIPLQWKNILNWGGLRGAISLALVLSLPAEFAPASDRLQAMVFGVVLFTLLVQGFSMHTLVQRSGLTERSQARDEYDLRRARAAATKAGYERLIREHHEGMLSEHSWKTLSGALQPHIAGLTDAMREVLVANPSVEAEELDAAWREFLRQQRSTLNDLYADRTISEEIFARLAGRIDQALALREIKWSRPDDLDDQLWQIQHDLPAAEQRLND